ncbi:methionyl-tRNA synthetase [Planoprotostelium fungivorum]|uniref:Methionine--tRNA ligase n=1 Tax=Planoprotostelium fungivorum TaxID=1890364 RepID=A0A2P6NWG7_9EUKA|nr:methionyl-tRNA synthetase [Planoprotostelium fungivorum]
MIRHILVREPKRIHCQLPHRTHHPPTSRPPINAPRHIAQISTANFKKAPSWAQRKKAEAQIERLDEHLRRGHLDEAYSAFQELRGTSLIDDIQYYTAIIELAAIKNDPFKFSKLFEKLRVSEVNTTILNSAIQVYTKTDDLRSIQNVLSLMNELGIKPHHKAISHILRMYARADDSAGFRKVLSSLDSLGVPQRTDFYNILLSLYVKRGDPSQVLRTFELFKTAGVDHDVRSYTILLTFFKKQEDLTRLVSVWSQMIQKGYKPDAVTFSVVMSAYAQAGDLKMAEKIRAVMEKQGFPLSQGDKTALFKMYTRYGDSEKASYWEKEMESHRNAIKMLHLARRLPLHPKRPISSFSASHRNFSTEVPPVASTTATTDNNLKPNITIDDFSKMDLRVAKVLSAETIPKSDNLLKITLSLGVDTSGAQIQRTVFSGIKKHYPEPEVLIGRKTLYLSNLQPRKMRFGVSEGMILAAWHPPTNSETKKTEGVFLLDVPEGAEEGMIVT